MPGFTSMDDLISEASASGKRLTTVWNKNFLPTTAAVAGEWHCLARGGGSPAADAIYNAGTNLLFQPVNDSTANGGGIRHGGNVAPDYKILAGASAFSAAVTSMPAIAMLVDLIGFYRITTTTTTTAQATTNTLATISTFTGATDDICTHSAYNLLRYTRVRLTTSGTLPAGLATGTDYYVIKLTDTTCKLASSYANAVAGTPVDITDTGSGTHNIQCLYPRYTNGAGVQAFMWANNATPLGAATPNLSLSAYVNSEGVAARATPTVLPIGKTAAANGLILYSGTGVGKYGPFMPLQGADAGIAEITSAQISVSYVSGEFSIGLCYPLALMPMTTLGVACERDFINQLPSMERLYDGANLVWLIYSGAATPVNSAFYGHITTIWG